MGMVEEGQPSTGSSDRQEDTKVLGPYENSLEESHLPV